MLLNLLFHKRKTLNQIRAEAVEAAYARKFELELERDSIEGALEGLDMRIKRLEKELDGSAKVDNILRKAINL